MGWEKRVVGTGGFPWAPNFMTPSALRAERSGDWLAVDLPAAGFFPLRGVGLDKSLMAVESSLTVATCTPRLEPGERLTSG
mgnify:CR=1 FL=1